MNNNFLKEKSMRVSTLLPNGKPRYIRCYTNNGQTFDQYTIVFTGQYSRKNNGVHRYIKISENPFQGAANTFYSNEIIDDPAYAHLGRKIKFELLPEECQKFVIMEYKSIWKIEKHQKIQF